MGAGECGRTPLQLFSSADLHLDRSLRLGMTLGPVGSRSAGAAAHNWTAGVLRPPGFVLLPRSAAGGRRGDEGRTARFLRCPGDGCWRGALATCCRMKVPSSRAIAPSPAATLSSRVHSSHALPSRVVRDSDDADRDPGVPGAGAGLRAVGGREDRCYEGVAVVHLPRDQVSAVR